MGNETHPVDASKSLAQELHRRLACHFPGKQTPSVWKRGMVSEKDFSHMVGIAAERKMPPI